MISCYNLKVVRPTAIEQVVFDEVTFDIDPGQWVEFSGRPGSGKSILFKILSLQLEPIEGQLIVAGRHVERLNDKRLAELRRNLGACSEKPALIEGLTPVDNIALPLFCRSESDPDMEGFVERLDLDLPSLPVRGLSRTQRRMVGLARAVVGGPELVLIDGGLEGLPRDFVEAFREYLSELKAAGSTILVFSSLEQPADNHCDVEYEINGPKLTGYEHDESQGLNRIEL
jgi:ABC-type multidrug transport system ATPase subunit